MANGHSAEPQAASRTADGTADDLGVMMHLVMVLDLRVSGGSALTTIVLSCAHGWAEVPAVDYSGYTDCGLEYLAAFETLTNMATKATVEGAMRFSIHAPLLWMTKSKIIEEGCRLGVNHGLTRSCYDPQPPSDARAYVP